MRTADKQILIQNMDERNYCVIFYLNFGLIDMFVFWESESADIEAKL